MSSKSANATPKAPVVERMDQLVGNTPLVRLKRTGEPRGATVYVKMEQFNPSGSLRDRYVAEILERGIASGNVVEGDTVAVAGLDDSAVAAALIGDVLGLKTRVFAPKNASRRLFDLVVRYGATIEWTSADGGLAEAIEQAAGWARQASDRLYVDSYRREAVRDAYAAMASEVLTALDGAPLGAFITSISTGGTFRHVARELRESYPSVRMGGAILGDLELPAFKEHRFNELARFSMREAFALRDELAASEGILLGPKGAACVGLALQLQKELGPEDVIVALNPDSGQRYLGWEQELIDPNDR
ncbi:pyridoxal-phosphate dependent enzyme [Lujinxingia sediminis]|uniref:Pyridoxal-phosphate dependent enzyme n=1 Tax=Lujinxingia sediminis TaxID=2480984 RepID=A0ABY0CXF6_9DELT|nr:pyridoxal-phosphate dependent enzyme [Lujinxingia sediminis]RVU48261.1 pyridoxal-phosphate dependent enzyme [Lujinxingia sediminis]